MKKYVFIALLTVSCAARRGVEAGLPGGSLVSGANSTQVDLLRLAPGDEKIYVQVDLGLPERQLFMVDTGASVSTISKGLAEDLSLVPLDQGGFLEGLGGMVRWAGVVLPPLHIGEITLNGIKAAVDVPGVPSMAGMMPVAGILGNNVWSNFVLTIDYPADVLEVALPGEVNVPDNADPLLFDGLHAYSMVQVEVDLPVAGGDAQPVSEAVPLAIDTGARGILLAGSAGSRFATAATEGEEPIFGIGGGDDLPANTFMRRTRRVPIQAVGLGGARVEDPGTAQWINFGDGEMIGPEGMPGLVGYNVLAAYRVIFDFPGRKLALTPSTREPRQLDGHAVLLEQDRARFGADPERGLYRGGLLAWLDEMAPAEEELKAYLSLHGEDREARVLLARILLYQGDSPGYWQALAGMNPADLLEEGELLAAVNGHLLEDRPERARQLADEAVALSPDDAEGWLAQADVLVTSGDFSGARQALATVNRLQENPDGHLLRRARLAMLEGDRIAALSHARRLLDLFPLSGFAIWYYALLADGPDELAALRSDLERAMARLHPEDRPTDFQLAAGAAMGDSAQVEALLVQGLRDDCDTLEEEAAQANCQAWYHALAGQRLDFALERAQLANTLAPHRSDYLDTLAMVQWRSGALAEALESQKAAARLSPDDVYLLWEVDWVRRALDARGGAG